MSRDYDTRRRGFSAVIKVLRENTRGELVFEIGRNKSNSINLNENCITVAIGEALGAATAQFQRILFYAKLPIPIP